MEAGNERIIAVLARVWFVFSTVTSIIGLVSIVDDLKSWGLVARNVMDWLVANVPPLHELLRLLGVAIHEVLDIYRGIVHPIFRWLFQWLPFVIPGAVIDLMTVIALSLAGFFRERISASGTFERAYDKFVRDLRKRLHSDGIYVSEEEELAVFNALIRDPSGWHYTEGEPPWHRNELLSRVLGSRVDQYHHEFGPNAYMQRVGVHEDWQRDFELHESQYASRWIHISALLISVIFLDWVFFAVLGAGA